MKILKNDKNTSNKSISLDKIQKIKKNQEKYSRNEI